MSTEASITIESKEDAIYVPVEAVYKSGDEKYVLVPVTSDDSTQSTKKVTVETGISNDTYVEITSGLAIGESMQIPRVQSSGNSSQEANDDARRWLSGRGWFPKWRRLPKW